MHQILMELLQHITRVLYNMDHLKQEVQFITRTRFLKMNIDNSSSKFQRIREHMIGKVQFLTKVLGLVFTLLVLLKLSLQLLGRKVMLLLICSM